MLHASLATGFALPRMVRVLESTGYLLGSSGRSRSQANLDPASPSQEDKTWDRLMHTTAWVVDTMQGGAETLLPPRKHASVAAEDHAQPTFYRGTGIDGKTRESPGQGDPAARSTRGGKGWRAIVQVRLIHARVRRHVIKRCQASTALSSSTSEPDLDDRGFDLSRDGIPINQADLAATLGAFCAVPLLALGQAGVNVSQAEAEAYVGVWRVVGFYSGVAPHIIQTHFCSAMASQVFTLCAGKHLASLPPLPPVRKGPAGLQADGALEKEVAGGDSIAVRLLRAVADRPPSRLSLHAHIAVVRHLAGEELSTKIGLPPVPPATQWTAVWVFRIMVALPPLVGRFHRAQFERKRIQLARILIPALIGAQSRAARGKLSSGAKQHAVIQGNLAPTLGSEEVPVEVEEAGAAASPVSAPARSTSSSPSSPSPSSLSSCPPSCSPSTSPASTSMPSRPSSLSSSSLSPSPSSSPSLVKTSSSPGTDWDFIRRLHAQVTVEMVCVAGAWATAPFWVGSLLLLALYHIGTI